MPTKCDPSCVNFSSAPTRRATKMKVTRSKSSALTTAENLAAQFVRGLIVFHHQSLNASAIGRGK